MKKQIAQRLTEWPQITPYTSLRRNDPESGSEGVISVQKAKK